METDTFFYQLLKHLPETLFALLGQPIARAAVYRFEAVEIKKSYRLDGLFEPTKSSLPVYFVEVQFQRKPAFYANLFAKVFSYLEANDPNQEWMAVALFSNRATEPKRRRPYKDLLRSPRVRRFYLDELSVAGAPPGLTLLRLTTANKSEAKELVSQLKERAEQETDCERVRLIVELTEEILMRHFTKLGREGIRRMFKLDDIRKSRVWQEAREEGIGEGLEKGIEKGKSLAQQELVKNWQAKGKSLKAIAELLEMPLAEVRRLAHR